jgi:hypothetical protein
MSSEIRKAFEQIYTRHQWGGISRSGPGSDPEATKQYIRFVNHYLATHTDYRSVVEFGCGDWATTKQLNLSRVKSYIGYDIVKEIIDENTKKYQSDNIRFQCADFIEDQTEAGDLLLIKDVLQHLSNKSVFQFIQTKLPRFKAAIITNDADKYYTQTFLRMPFRKTRLQVHNTEIVDGGSRPLKLHQHPFDLQGKVGMYYKNSFPINNGQLTFIKMIFVWEKFPKRSYFVAN